MSPALLNWVINNEIFSLFTTSMEKNFLRFRQSKLWPPPLPAAHKHNWPWLAREQLVCCPLVQQEQQNHQTAPAAGALLWVPVPSPVGPPALLSQPHCHSPPIGHMKGDNGSHTAQQPLHLPEAYVLSPIKLLGGAIQKLLLNNFRFVLGGECSSFSTCLTRAAAAAAGESGC